MCDFISGMAGLSAATNVALAGAGAAMGFLGRLFWKKMYSQSCLCWELVFPKDIQFYYFAFSSKTARLSTLSDTQLISRFQKLSVNKINFKVVSGTQAFQLPRPWFCLDTILKTKLSNRSILSFFILFCFFLGKTQFEGCACTPAHLKTLPDSQFPWQNTNDRIRQAADNRDTELLATSRKKN